MRLRRLTRTAMLTALSVAVLYLGVLLDVLSLTAVAIASLFMLFAVRELPLSFRLLLYFGTVILSALLLPTPEAALLYASFGGLYPMIKFPLERLRKPFSLLFKLLYCNLTVALFEAGAVFLFAMPAEAWYITLLLFLVANPTFLLYDLLLRRLLYDYEIRLRPRIARYL